MASTHMDKLPVREEIISAAGRLFAARGYDRVSLDDVARRTCFYPATVRLYFPNKEALYLEVVLRGMRVLNARYEECTETASAGTEKLRALGKGLIEFSRRYPDYYRQPYSGVPVGLYRTGGGAEAAMDLHDRNLEMLYSAIEACVQDSCLTCDLEPQKLMVYLIALSIAIFGSDPCWRLALEAGGIDYDRFARNFPCLEAGPAAKNRQTKAETWNCGEGRLPSR